MMSVHPSERVHHVVCRAGCCTSKHGMTWQDVTYLELQHKGMVLPRLNVTASRCALLEPMGLHAKLQGTS
jgi:hypothetical protein